MLFKVKVPYILKIFKLRGHQPPGPLDPPLLTHINTAYLIGLPTLPRPLKIS